MGALEDTTATQPDVNAAVALPVPSTGKMETSDVGPSSEHGRPPVHPLHHEPEQVLDTSLIESKVPVNLWIRFHSSQIRLNSKDSVSKSFVKKG